MDNINFLVDMGNRLGVNPDDLLIIVVWFFILTNVATGALLWVGMDLGEAAFKFIRKKCRKGKSAE